MHSPSFSTHVCASSQADASERARSAASGIAAPVRFATIRMKVTCAWVGGNSVTTGAGQGAGIGIV